MLAALISWFKTMPGRLSRREISSTPPPAAAVAARRVALVIIDITGYTGYLRFHKTSLIHAHEIISLLLESVIDRASHPLILNKLEGDAALMYAVLGADQTDAARDIARQTKAFFKAFRARAVELAGSRSQCPCEACRGILDLRLKAFLHVGIAAFRKIRSFEELGGEDVILVHRLLKNSISERQYMFLTEQFLAACADLQHGAARHHVETYEDIGLVAGRVIPV